MTAAAITVLLADDDELVRDALAEIIRSEPTLEVVGVAGDAEEAARLATLLRPAVAVIDMRMGGGGGRVAAAEIRRLAPETRVLALSALDDRGLVADMVGLGASGYILKGSNSSEIVEAVQRAARGQFSMSAEMVGALVGGLTEESARGRESQRAREVAESRVKAMLDSSPGAIVIVNGANDIVYANPRLAALFRYEAEELVGRPLELLLPKRSAKAMIAKLRAAGATRKPLSRRTPGLRGVRADGTDFPAEAMTAGLVTPEGPETMVAFIDLTATTNAPDTVLRNEGLFQQVLDVAPDAIVVVDKDGVIQLVNQQAEKLFGHPRSEMLQAKVEMLIPQRLAKKHVGHRAGYLADPRVRPMGFGLELAGRRADGSEFPVDISLSPFESPNGWLVVAAIRDITERRKVEDLRRKDEERLRQLVDASPDGVVIIDSEGVLLEVNSQAEALFGYRREELVGNPVETLLPERFRPTHVGHRTGYLARPRSRPMGLGLELAGRRKDGTEFPVDISLAHLKTDDGILGVAYIRDVSERRRAERDLVIAQLVQAQEEERIRIASDIHDDVIQAITAAGLRLQLLRRQLRDDAQLQTLAKLEETVQVAITRLRRLMFDLRPPAVETGGLVGAVRTALEQLQADSGVAFTLSGSLPVEPAVAIRTIVYRLVQESLVNVRKHAHATHLEVRIEVLYEGISGIVEDDGVGFDVESIEARPGHLGLAAMTERAEKARGWLRLASRPGGGTRVSFWIPADIKAPAEVSG